MRKKAKIATPKSEPNENTFKFDSESEWKFNYAEWPEDISAYQEDGIVKFHKPKEEETEEIEEGSKETEKKGPKPTDWRWGPAQYWYDMLGLPEAVDDYDYGLKFAIDHINDDIPNAVKKGPETSNGNWDKENEKPSKMTGELEFSPEAFLMVTQANWEEDVIWNGDDIRHKVMQKLNSKTNAAGWVPTSFNRTAGSFSQPGKTQLPGIKLQTLQHKKPENGDDTFYSIFPVENEDLVYGKKYKTIYR